MSNKDTIYRQDAIDALWKALFDYEDATEKRFQESDELNVSDWFLHRIFVQNMNDIDRAIILGLPSAEPRKKGKWIKIPEFCGDDVSGFIDNHFSCSECKKEAEINPWGFYILSDFCPNCGADMRGEQDDTD